MKVYKNMTNGRDLQEWAHREACAGAKDRVIDIDRSKKWEEVFDYLNECYYGEMSDTELNDTLWFDEYIIKMCRVDDE